MGSVFLALQTDADGRASPVAIKKLHAHLAEDSGTVDAFVDEARIAYRLRHPNVVRVHDVVPIDGQLVIVMEWIEGIALRSIARRSENKNEERLPLPVIRRILVDALDGLHAAHELKDDRGAPLDIVHRDISPQNLLVGTDGLTRVTDFGIALARGRLAPATVQGGVKGKIPYLSPEQVNRSKVDRRSDIFAAGVVAWELLAGKRLFVAPSEGEIMAMILREPLVPPSSERLDVPLDLDETVLKALERKAERRFQTAAELAKAIEEGGPVASHEEVGRLVIAAAGASLAARRQKLAAASERPDVRTLREEMTATFNVPTVKQTRTSIAPASARASRASRLSIPPPVTGRVTIDPTGVATSLPPPSLRPVRAQRSTTTLSLVAAVLTLMLAIVVVLKYRGNDDTPTKTSFPPAPAIPTADQRDPRLAPMPAPLAVPTPVTEPAPFQNPVIVAPTPVEPAPAAPPSPRVHRPKRDAGAGKQGKPFMPDDL